MPQVSRATRAAPALPASAQAQHRVGSYATLTPVPDQRLSRLQEPSRVSPTRPFHTRLKQPLQPGALAEAKCARAPACHRLTYVASTDNYRARLPLEAHPHFQAQDTVSASAFQSTLIGLLAIDTGTPVKVLGDALEGLMMLVRTLEHCHSETERRGTGAEKPWTDTQLWLHMRDLGMPQAMRMLRHIEGAAGDHLRAITRLAGDQFEQVAGKHERQAHRHNQLLNVDRLLVDITRTLRQGLGLPPAVQEAACTHDLQQLDVLEQRLLITLLAR